MTSRKWADIPGYENHYQASNHGDVRSLDRVTTNNRRIKGKALKPRFNTWGYRQVSLCKGNKAWQPQVHRLVLLCFVGPCPDGYVANHKNGNKSDNRIDNLEYVTPLENERHSRNVLGKNLSGSNSNFAKLTESQVLEIREKWAAGKYRTYVEVSKDYGTIPDNIGYIIRRKTWAHI